MGKDSPERAFEKRGMGFLRTGKVGLVAEANKKFLASYYHNGSWWNLSFYATDWDDAETICRKLNLRLDGEHMMTIPAYGGSWIPSLICWLKNKWEGKPQEGTFI